MEITKVRVFGVREEGNFVGFANMVFDDCLAVNGIRVFRAQDGAYKFVCPDRKPTKKEEAKKVRPQHFNPVSNEMRIKMLDAITDAINEALEKKASKNKENQ